MLTPKAFVSYSWDDDSHRDWVKALALKLRADGVDVTLDRWAVAPGDLLPKFMESSVRENDFVLIVCTPNYKLKSDNRQGGMGYEGDIMTGETFAGKDPRKFIPILRSGDWRSSAPSWLAGKYGLNFTGDPYTEQPYDDLLNTLHGTREQPPPIGFRSALNAMFHGATSNRVELTPEAFAILNAAALADGLIATHETDDGLVIFAGDRRFGGPDDAHSDATNRDSLKVLASNGFAERDSEHSLRVTNQGRACVRDGKGQAVAESDMSPHEFEPIRILTIIANEVGTPRNDGTRGSALYAVPFQLSRPATDQWARQFVETWNHPPRYSTRHRPRIARVEGDRIILDGTTVEEVAEVHRETLKVVVAKVNQDVAEWERRQCRAAEEEAERQRQHRQAVLDAAKRISFD
jgi:TIR domain